MGIIGQTDLCVFWCNVLKKKSSASVRNVKLESIHEENQTNSNWGNYAKKKKKKTKWPGCLKNSIVIKDKDVWWMVLD